jgi:hypothetical protein
MLEGSRSREGQVCWRVSPMSLSRSFPQSLDGYGYLRFVNFRFVARWVICSRVIMSSLVCGTRSIALALSMQVPCNTPCATPEHSDRRARFDFYIYLSSRVKPSWCTVFIWHPPWWPCCICRTFQPIETGTIWCGLFCALLWWLLRLTIKTHHLSSPS